MAATDDGDAPETTLGVFLAQIHVANLRAAKEELLSRLERRKCSTPAALREVVKLYEKETRRLDFEPAAINARLDYIRRAAKELRADLGKIGPPALRVLAAGTCEMQMEVLRRLDAGLLNAKTLCKATEDYKAALEKTGLAPLDLALRQRLLAKAAEFLEECA